MGFCTYLSLRRVPKTDILIIALVCLATLAAGCATSGNASQKTAANLSTGSKNFTPSPYLTATGVVIVDKLTSPAGVNYAYTTACFWLEYNKKKVCRERDLQV